jgi:hypothetical protein
LACGTAPINRKSLERLDFWLDASVKLIANWFHALGIALILAGIVAALIVVFWSHYKQGVGLVAQLSIAIMGCIV